MKKMLSRAIAVSLASAGLMGLSAVVTPAAAEVSANAGIMSQYIFRGMTQRDSAAFNGGVDYEHDSGLYVGAWAAQVGWGTDQGLEYDVYGGFEKEFGGVTLGAGFTGYYYTDKYSASNLTGFDSAYEELNFKAGYGPVTLTINPGYHKGALGMKDKNYVFYSLEGEYNGFYAKYGLFDKKAEGGKGTGSQFDAMKDGNFLQAGYKTEVSGFDLDVFVIQSSKELNMTGLNAGAKEDITGVFAISKAF